MKDSQFAGLLVISAAVLYLWSKAGMGPGSKKAVAAPSAESSAVPAARVNLISEKPPADVRLYELGSSQYAKFNDPIDLGNGFYQWGVTVEGFPVISMNPPESYNSAEWVM